MVFNFCAGDGLSAGIRHICVAAPDEGAGLQDRRLLEAARRRYLPHLLLLRHRQRLERRLEYAQYILSSR